MKKQITNNKNIDVAKEFYNCAMSYYNSDKFVDFVPYIVNISLSCELLIKSLLYNNGKGISSDEIIKQKHHLYNLYNLLQDEQKQEIRLAINNYDVDEELRKAANSFSRARYYYLNSLFGNSKPFEVKPIFLKKFNLELIKICEKMTSKN